MTVDSKRLTMSLFSKPKQQLRHSKSLGSPDARHRDAFLKRPGRTTYEDLESENKMLQEQVTNQKYLIVKLVKQLENWETEDTTKVQPASPTRSISSNSSSLQTLVAENSEKDKMIEQLTAKNKQLLTNIAELESQLSASRSEYQSNLSKLSNSVSLISENQKFLSHPTLPGLISSPQESDLKLSKFSRKEQGETFVLRKLSIC
ncbi:hypothetical protein OGAPHI_001970 [Ogataea philodendri]|uniref:Uncharacterized protein n=1 Tax=Ogataea philodendri TaxID=1378263 RepID=A0A9P8PAK4_9ASCO|nr:uncharacterized protein OGAPHI_001970 [Ogataea philodendri]KAH3668216.1 hypothetical protein OGAPHI_001970 [Ogataea philodendri]